MRESSTGTLCMSSMLTQQQQKLLELVPDSRQANWKGMRHHTNAAKAQQGVHDRVQHLIPVHVICHSGLERAADSTVTYLCTDCFGHQESSPYIELSSLRATTAVTRQCLVPNCPVLTSRICLHQVSLQREVTVEALSEYSCGRSLHQLSDPESALLPMHGLSCSCGLMFCTMAVKKVGVLPCLRHWASLDVSFINEMVSFSA